MSHRRRDRSRAIATIRVDGFSEHGTGTGLDERGNRWSVRYAVPGSLIRAGGKPQAGTQLEALEAAPGEQAAPCGAFGICGGCQWQTMTLARQREEKLRMLNELLDGLGGRCGGISGAPEELGYRNKMEFTYGDMRFLPPAEHRAEKAGNETTMERTGRFLGFHAAGRFDRIVDLEECPLMSAAMNRSYRLIRTDTLASVWEVWNPHRQIGFWRHLVLREGNGGNNGGKNDSTAIVATLHTMPTTPEQVEWIRSRAHTWGISGLRLIAGDSLADAIRGTPELLWGSAEIRERLGRVDYRLSADAFFQVNHAGAERLMEEVERMAGTGELLIDLYCGTGAIGLYLTAAGQFQRVTGVELNAAAVECARENAAANGLNAEFLCGAVEDLIRDGSLTIPEEATVIVDPPRSGLHRHALTMLKELRLKRLIYIACKPTSLLRDALELKDAGWSLDTWSAVDLFPQTGHVEVVGLFTKNVHVATPTV